ncbi:MAG TPA: hypothetical protein VIR57_17360 [Chloroflexota bacterium]
MSTVIGGGEEKVGLADEAGDVEAAGLAEAKAEAEAAAAEGLAGGVAAGGGLAELQAACTRVTTNSASSSNVMPE